MFATVRKLWGNGGKGLVIVAFAVALTLLLNIAVLIWALRPDEEFAPMYGRGYEEPQRVSGDVYRAGDSVHVYDVEKCNSLDRPVIVSGRRFWKKEGGNSVFAGEGTGLWSPGECRLLEFDNQTPDTLTPGTWHLVGVERAFSMGREQVIGWETSQFEIVE